MARRRVLSLRLKAQYIWYLGGGLVGLLIIYAAMYLCKVNTYVCLVIIIGLATALFMYIYKLSNKYGEHGIMKKAAGRGVPKVIKIQSRKIFIK